MQPQANHIAAIVVNLSEHISETGSIRVSISYIGAKVYPRSINTI
jgi:hypothetical protein